MVTVETGGNGVKGSQTQENKPMMFSFREGENTEKGLERGYQQGEWGERVTGLILGTKAQLEDVGRDCLFIPGGSDMK